MNRLRPVLIILALIAGAFFLTASVYTDWLWFRSVHYERLFLTGWYYRLGAGVAFGGFAFIFLTANILLARRLSPSTRYLSANLQFELFISRAREYFDKYFNLAAFLGSAALAVLIGVSMGSTWEAWLRYGSSVAAGVKDPLFGRDIGFYFFTLPVLQITARYLFFLVLVTIAAAGFVHLVRGTINLGRGFRGVYTRGIAHLSVLAALLMVIISSNWWFAGFDLLYSRRGTVYGAGYTDAHVLLPAYRVMFFIGLGVAALIVIGGVSRRWFLPVAGLAVFGVAAIVGTAILPAIVQQLRVAPNEIAREKPYIARSIKNTRQAFGLDEVTSRPFPISEKLDDQALEKNKGAIDGLRLWDYRPLKTTYGQIQEIRLYYKFNDVDLDRYLVDGRYRQIALSARELDINQLPESSRTWINRHLVYTHGYGVVASPVNETAGEGLPNLIIKNIPPQSSTDLKVKRPEIYFGESTGDYALINTKTKEFDYPAGDKNKYTDYKGAGGVSLSTLTSKLAFAYRFGTIKLALSDALTSKSRILFHRDIKDRLQTLTPFISYDSDPYVVIADGKLYWMVDGYTATDRYPYSKPAANGANYMRNSVKAVINAYDGTTDFYISDPNDPIIKTYARAYPGTFKPMSKMNKGLLEHVRYPEALFRTQAEVFANFHMTDPQVFYNNEDLWGMPEEIYQSETQLMEPYYAITQLPGEHKSEFVLMLPFTPTNKSNMISWLAARNDPPNYGKLVLHTFSKDKLVYGPLQIEARLDQDPEISRQLSLWSQRGSQVIRGNLLVIPIDGTILYVEPIYLQAESGELPELKRVAAGLGDKVVMEPTLEEALAALTGKTGAPAPVSTDNGNTGNTGNAAPEELIEPATGKSASSENVLIKRAADALEKAEQAQKDGDWAEYGRQLEDLKSALKDLQ